MTGRPPEPSADDGRALIEVVFLAVLLLIPVVYLMISLLRVQAATLAVSQAARDAGRAMDSAPSVQVGVARARELALVALADQSVPDNGVAIQFVAPGAACAPENSVPPTLEGGAVYDICVTAVLAFPGIPSVLTGSRNTVTGVYTLHVGEFRSGG